MKTKDFLYAVTADKDFKAAEQQMKRAISKMFDVYTDKAMRCKLTHKQSNEALDMFTDSIKKHVLSGLEIHKDF